MPIPSKIPWISKTKYKGNEIIKISMIRRIEFFRNLLYFFSPSRLRWYKKKKDKPKQRIAENSFMKSKIAEAALVVITTSKLIWFDSSVVCRLVRPPIFPRVHNYHYRQQAQHMRLLQIVMSEQRWHGIEYDRDTSDRIYVRPQDADQAQHHK